MVILDQIKIMTKKLSSAIIVTNNIMEIVLILNHHELR